MSAARLPRDLHPVAWWVWAIGLSTAASFTTNPLVLLTIIGVATLVVFARRSEQPWADSFRIYVMVAIVIVVMRVLFRVLFGGGAEGGEVILDLPEIPLPDWVLGITLLGPVTREAVLAGLYDGLRLATIVICVGAANSLANPKRLLRSVPAALHEVGRRPGRRGHRAAPAGRQRPPGPRRAGAARGGHPSYGHCCAGSWCRCWRTPSSGRCGWRRGWTPAATAARVVRRGASGGVTGALMLVGLCGVCVGVYAGLDHTVPRLLAPPMLVVGVTAAVAGLVTAGRRVGRSTYRPDPWLWPEFGVMLSGIVDRARGLVGGRDTSCRWPTPTSRPSRRSPWSHSLGTLVGALAAAIAPEPRLVTA